MIANHIHHAGTGSNLPDPGIIPDGAKGLFVMVLAKLIGFISGSFLIELAQAVTIAGAGAAASFAVSYVLNRKFKK